MANALHVVVSDVLTLAGGEEWLLDFVGTFITEAATESEENALDMSDEDEDEDDCKSNKLGK